MLVPSRIKHTYPLSLTTTTQYFILEFIKKNGLQDQIRAQTQYTIEQNDHTQAHVPVMLNEVTDALEKQVKIKKSREYQQQTQPGLMVDLTFGLGGHSLHLLKRHPNLQLIGLEIDKRVLAHFEQYIRPTLDPLLSTRISLYNLNYFYLDSLLAQQQRQADWILGDFGVNSLHFDRKEWGFSYTGTAPLDMRFDPSKGQSAAHLLNNLDGLTLEQLFCTYGDIKQSRQLAHKIVEYRLTQPIINAQHLRECVLGSGLAGHSNYATLVKICQALRISVNQELVHLSGLMEQVPSLLAPQGRAVFLTFHSLERHIVKSAIRQFKRDGLAQPMDVHLKPSASEIKTNPRSRSTQLYSMLRL